MTDLTERVLVTKSDLVEALAIAAAATHLLRFTRPPQQDRVAEMSRHLFTVGAEAGITEEDMSDLVQAWFHELAHYLDSGMDSPAPCSPWEKLTKPPAPCEDHGAEGFSED